MSPYEVIVRCVNGVCLMAEVTPAPSTARTAQELAGDLAGCLKPGHVVNVAGSADEGRAES